MWLVRRNQSVSNFRAGVTFAFFTVVSLFVLTDSLGWLDPTEDDALGMIAIVVHDLVGTFGNIPAALSIFGFGLLLSKLTMVLRL